MVLQSRGRRKCIQIVKRPVCVALFQLRTNHCHMVSQVMAQRAHLLRLPLQALLIHLTHRSQSACLLQLFMVDQHQYRPQQHDRGQQYKGQHNYPLIHRLHISRR